MSVTAAGEDPDTADASVRGTVNELVLALHGRIPLDSLQLDGNRRLFDQLVAWDPDEQGVTTHRSVHPRGNVRAVGGLLVPWSAAAA